MDFSESAEVENESASSTRARSASISSISRAMGSTARRAAGRGSTRARDGRCDATGKLGIRGAVVELLVTASSPSPIRERENAIVNGGERRVRVVSAHWWLPTHCHPRYTFPLSYLIHDTKKSNTCDYEVLFF